MRIWREGEGRGRGLGESWRCFVISRLGGWVVRRSWICGFLDRAGGVGGWIRGGGERGIRWR